MMDWGGSGGWGAGGVLMVLFSVIFVGAVIVGIIFLVRGLSGGSAPGEPTVTGQSTSRKRALGILEERYASGEIDREEFLRRKEDLGPGAGG